MNKSSEQNPAVSPAKPGDQTRPNPNRVQDPKETAQEAVHQVTPKDSIKAQPDKPDARPEPKPNAGKSPPPAPASDEVKPPMYAAKGNDELMSQQQSQKQS